MQKRTEYSLGLYEKAMPAGLGFARMLECAAQTGFDRLEISIDESDARLARLDWTGAQKQELVGQIRQSGVPIRTMCLSGHRKYPFGAHDAAVRARSLEIMKKAVDFAAEVGVSVIQLAGYDVYYEPGDAQTRAWYDANPDLFTRYAGDSFPYEEVKQIIEKRMREEVYDSLVQDLLRGLADRP